MRAWLALLALACASAAWADPPASDLSPPPLVEVGPSDAPVEPPPPAPAAQPAPQRPAARPPTSQVVPYPYSPYAQVDPARAAAAARPPPGPEVGLMVTEVLFGTLTAAPAVLLPYYLFLKPVVLSPSTGMGIDPTLANLVFVMVFASIPLGVAQTEQGIANSSRFYVTDSWVGALTALGAQAGVLALYMAMRQSSPGAPAEQVLLAGSVLGVPVVTMAAINLARMPRGPSRSAWSGALLSHGEDGRWAVSVPTPLPVQGGALLPVLGGRF